MARVELGERIASLREEQALTQAELAERARISPSTLSQIESGKVPRPHVGTIRKIARALNVEPQDLRRAEEPALAGKAEAPREAGQAQTSTQTVEEFERALARALEPVRAEALREQQAANRAFESDRPQRHIGDLPEAEAGNRFLHEFSPNERPIAFGELALGYARLERDNTNLQDALRERDKRIAQLEEAAHLKEEREQETAR